MFWENLTFRLARCQNRPTEVKSSPNKENASISKKSAQNARLAPCGASFGKISLFLIADLKIVLLASTHHQSGKRCDYYEKCTRRTFGRAEQVLANLTFLHTRSENLRTGLKSSPNREGSSISKKSAQNARLGPCWASFGKISLFHIPDLKIITKLGKRFDF